MQNELISVVVCVYNGEKYLARCLDSLINQKYKRIEIVLVDDGSTDMSGSICDEYAKKDDRVRTIHQPNRGLAGARNVGIRESCGEYLAFCDADDVVTEYYIENLYTALKETNADMSVCAYKYCKNNYEIEAGSACEKKQIKLVDKEECLERSFYQDQMYTTVWGKLYSKKALVGVVYPEGKLYEDIPAMYQMIFNCDRFALIPNTDYYYIINDESLTNKPFSVKEMDAIAHMDEVGKIIDSKYPELTHAYRVRAFLLYAFIMFKIQPREYVEVRKDLWSRMKAIRKEVLSDKRVARQTKMIARSSYLGYHMTYRLYRMVKK